MNQGGNNPYGYGPPGYPQQPGYQQPGYQQPGYQQPAGGFGAPPGAPMMHQPMGYSPMAGPMAPSVKPLRRNAFMVGIFPILATILGVFIFVGIAIALDMGALAGLAQLAQLAGTGWLLFNMLRALDELRKASGNPTFQRWPIWIPIYNLIYWLSIVPQEVQRARQLRGLPPTTRPIIFYFFLPVVALQSDLNELANS